MLHVSSVQSSLQRHDWYDQNHVSEKIAVGVEPGLWRLRHFLLGYLALGPMYVLCWNAERPPQRAEPQPGDPWPDNTKANENRARDDEQLADGH